MTYEDDITIDEEALDVEWLEQARLMKKYCDLTAEAHKNMDLAKEQLDFTRAMIEREIRADPESAGLVAGSRGITEGSIQAAIQVHDDYKAVSRAYINAKYEYEVTIGAVRAFDQRKTALENLVRLHGQSYFSTPNSGGDISERRRDHDRSAQSRIRMRRRS